LKLKTLNLASRSDTGGTNEKNAKFGECDRKQGHVTYLVKYWKTSKTVNQTIKKTVNIALLMYKAMQQPV